MLCKWVYIIGNTGRHCPIHFRHFVRHEARFATIVRTRLTRSMAANELGFFVYTRCGTCSSSYGDVFRMASPMVISTGRPTCAQDDGGIQAKVLCFSYVSHLVWSVFVSSGLRGCLSFLLRSFGLQLFASCNSRSINIVCPRKLNWGRQYCQFMFKLCEVGAIQPLGFCLGHCN